jgi:SAM-dependent methyltransferase
MKPLLRPFYNTTYSFLQFTLPFNPFIPKKINGTEVRSGHARYEQETNPELDELIVEALQKQGIRVSTHTIDLGKFRDYLSSAHYPSTYYGNDEERDENFIEKALEHFTSLQFFELNEDSVLIDIASGNSPFSSIIQKRSGTPYAYAQDLSFPKGIKKNKIGGHASFLPFNDSSADVLTLHCSLEHFEGNEDQLFFKEAMRVLKKGGRCIVLPFYLSSAYTIHIDPVNNFLKSYHPKLDDEGALVKYCDSRQAFTRHYDVRAFKKRVLDNTPGMSVEIFKVSNFKAVHADCYLRFAAVFTKQ